MNFKYIPRSYMVLGVLTLISLVFLYLSVLLESFIWFLFFLFWLFFPVIYGGLIIKDVVDIPSNKELRELLRFLEKKEAIDYVRELICNRYISKLHHIGIELDLKFGTNLIQKKGSDVNHFRDKAFVIKIERLYYKIINECN